MLGNFEYYNPTKLYFGQNSLSFLKKELSRVGQNIMLIYGGGSIKTIGLYEEIIDLLEECNKNVVEDSGVMPNPTRTKLEEGCKIAKANQVDFILAVGGGSVIDYGKAVAAGAYCEENPWERYFIRGEEVNNYAIPLGTILTMVGTGSEMNDGSVITDEKTNQKLGCAFGETLYPKFSILNPTYTYSVPQYQMVAGIFDIMSHILEQYFSNEDDNTSDYIMEGLLKSLIHSSKIAQKEPKNYEARSNIMWTATWALNSLVEKGKRTDWMVHMIGQAIGGYTDATHGMTLSAVSIPYYKAILPYGLSKFKRYAVNVWGVSTHGKSEEEIALEGLEEMESYMKELGLVLNCSQLGVTSNMIDNIVENIYILDGGYKKLSKEEIKTIIDESMKYEKE